MIKKKNKVGRPVVNWPEEKIVLLKKLYPANPNDLVAEKLDITISALRNAVIRFKVKKNHRYWDKSEEKFLLISWPIMSAEEIGKKLKKTRWAVINKYRELKK